MYSNQTYEVIKQRTADNILIDIDKREGSFLDSMISAVCENLANTYVDMEDILNLVFIKDGFEEYLDKRVSDFGVYRKLGVKSTGTIKVTGQLGEVITNGTLLTFNDLNYQVLNDITLSDTDNILYVEALEVGYKYNLTSNTNFTLVEPNINITSLINEVAFSGGVDVETDEELRARFDKINNCPTTSGNKNHYEIWALEVDGVGKANVYPLHAGPGTVKVMVVGNDNQPVSTEIITNVETHINEVKPLGCTLTVITPTSLDVAVVGSIELKVGFLLDDVKAEFEENLREYLKTTTSEMTYSKVYGVLVNCLGVGDIGSLTLNGGINNIAIPSDKLINVSSVTMSEVV